MALDKKRILSADDLGKETLSIPEWGGDVIVRGLTGEEREEYENMAAANKAGDKNATRHWRARLVAATVIDDDGNDVFGPADVQALSHKNAAILDRIVDVALRLSGLMDDESPGK